MIKQKKTKKKNVNVNQTVVVNIQKGKRNPRAKAGAPSIMSAPQIIPPQVGSAYHQAVYGARAPAIPSMGSIPGYYAGMISPFNAPLHIASEVQQAQLRQANELAGVNVARVQQSASVSQHSTIAPIHRLPKMEEEPGHGKQEAKPITVPLSLTPSKPFQPSLPMEAPESVLQMKSLSSTVPEVAATAASSSSSSSSSSYETDYARVIEWIDRQSPKMGNSPVGLSKDAFIQQISNQLGRQFTVDNLKNVSFDTIKEKAKRFINTLIRTGQ